jgi:hypothetical protein
MISEAGAAVTVRAAAVHDDGSEDLGARFAGFAAAQRRRGLRVLGLVMERRGEGPLCKRPMFLVDVETGREFPASQTLGPGSTSCQLDPAAFADASVVLREALPRSPQLVVCNRFGALEAGGKGFADELLALMAAEVPMLTVVAEPYVAAWREFSGDAPLLPPVSDAWSAWLSNALAHGLPSAG